ncbi:unnamed protein product [Trichobilharzia szidati]|nr:unnamed protein product [Trichobilharzia szidati]
MKPKRSIMNLTEIIILDVHAHLNACILYEQSFMEEWELCAELIKFGDSLCAYVDHLFTEVIQEFPNSAYQQCTFKLENVSWSDAVLELWFNASSVHQWLKQNESVNFLHLLKDEIIRAIHATPSMHGNEFTLLDNQLSVYKIKYFENGSNRLTRSVILMNIISITLFLVFCIIF